MNDCFSYENKVIPFDASHSINVSLYFASFSRIKDTTINHQVTLYHSNPDILSNVFVSS